MSKEYTRDNMGFEYDKLTKQLKLLSELDVLYEKQKKSTADAKKSLEIINKISETRNKLEQEGIKHIKTQVELNQKAEEIDRLRGIKYDEMVRLNKEIEKSQQKQVQEEQKLKEESQKRYNDQISNEAKKLQAMTKTSEIEEKMQDVAEEILKTTAETTAEKRKQAIESDKRYKQLQKELEAEKKRLQQEKEREQRENKNKDSINKSLGSLKIPGLGSVSQLKDFGELSTSAKLISVAADTFNEAVGKFTQLFTGGLNRIADRANSQFQGISVQSGMSYSTYRNGVGGMNTTLSRYGLQDNVRTSDIQDMMSKLANTGMGQEQLFANAIETVITKNIVPYLELGTDSMQQFNQNVNGDLMKQVRGIAKINQEMFEGNQVATKYLQDQLEYLAPMSAVAELDLIQNSEEMMAYYQDLRKQGLSDSQIAKEMSKVRRIQDDASGVLKNGSIDERLTVINGERKGIDFTSDSFGIATELGDVTSQLASNGPNGGGLSTYIYGNWAGFGGRGQAQYGRLGLDRQGAASRAKVAGSMLNSASESALADFSSGKNQTAQQKQEASLENISSQIAMWKVNTGVWFDVLTTAVKGIANILLTYFAGKAVGSIGGKLGGAGKLGTAVSGGLSKIGGGLAGTEATSTVMGGLGTIAGVAAGGAMAVHGGLEMVNDIEEGDSARAVMSGVEMAAGATAAGAFIAAGISNPVGWVALAVGGAALLGKHLYDLATETGDISDELNEQSRIVIDDFKAQHEKREDELYEIKDKLKQEDDIQKQKKILIDAGIATEKQLQDEQYNSKEELIQLTNQYIASTKELNGASEEVLTQLEDKQNNEQNNITTSMYSLMNMDFNKMDDGQKQAAADFGKQYYRYMQELAKGGDKDALWRIDEWKKKGIDLTDGNFTKDDLYAIKNLGSDKTNNEFIKRFFMDDDRVHKITTYDTVQNYLGRDTSFTKKDFFSALTLIKSAIQEPDIEKAKGMLAQVKQMGLTWEELGSVDGGRKLQESLTAKGISSYRVGTDSIPYDNYPAMLHEGEAVLTASTANELRSLVDEYRNTKYDSARIEKAIQDQTAILVESLNAIYSKIPASDETQAQEVMPGNLKQNYRKMSLPFN